MMLGTLDKGIFHFRIHDQIHISLTVTCICICQTVELLRQDLQTLGEQDYFCGMNGNLAGLCLEYLSLDADDITDIQLLESLIGFFADAVPCYVSTECCPADPAHCRKMLCPSHVWTSYVPQYAPFLTPVPQSYL